MIENITFDKDLYLFELDDVLFPKRDYLVQVYYLFGSFYEFTEGQSNANDIAKFMTKIYDLHGEEHVLLATKMMFNINNQYDDNFYRLLANAQIPLKLEFTQQTKLLLDQLIDKKKKIAILTKGNPIEQLNKIKFIDWGSLDYLKDSIKIYFADELNFRAIDPIEYIAKEFNINSKQISYIEYEKQHLQ